MGNIVEVAKHLHTEPSYATKFFGMEVGAVSQFDTKRNVGIVNGVHQTQELQKMLKKFIREFILCQNCGLPELQFKVHQKKNVLLQKCASCGWKGSNASGHKVKSYIINHPPAKKSSKDKGKKKDKDKKSRDKRKNKDKDSKNGSPAKEEDTDYKELGWDNDDKWSVDVSEEAVNKRKEEEMATLATKQRKKTNRVVIEKDSSPAQILRNYIASQERTQSEILDEMRRIALAREFDQKKKLQMCIEALCKLDTLDNFAKGLAEYKEILATFAENENDAKIFMGVFEEFVCRRNPTEFMPTVYKLLLALYDNDIVDEEDLLKWDALPHDKAVIVDQDEAQEIREKAAPFIKWLKESDSGSSGEEEEESEEED